MNQKEKELFLELCAFRIPNSKKIERISKANSTTSDELGMLFANRMAGVAYCVLKESDLLDLVNREFRNSLRNAFLLKEKINEDFLGCINFLSTELEACGVPYALRKAVLKTMLSRTQIIPIRSAKIRTLESYDFLLHLCSHLYKEAMAVPWIRMRRDMTLYKYCDIYGMLTDFTYPKEEDIDG